ncbi:elongation factor G [Methylorubrum podarium]|uniref:Elongation factor G n=1 Tax=Methylorubrum podarium TaxID=200476 RepID=A0ABV1QLY6_9HYPH
MPAAPWPLLEIAVAPTSKAGRSSLRGALLGLMLQNPELDFSTDAAADQFILKAVTETCLATAVERLRSCPTAFHFGQPQVAYRETLTRRREIDHTHKRVPGGRGQFARVKLLFEPNAPGAGSAFESKINESTLPGDYVRGVEKGLRSVRMAGVLAGFPVIDVRAELIDGASHAIDSSPLAFEIAARAAFREALQGNSVLLEPVMAVEIAVPERYADGVVSDLRARRGLIGDRSARGGLSVVTATVPLAEMLGFGSRLRTVAGSDAHVAMAFSHYAPVPAADRDPPPADAALRA